jgi:hypothetical protein
MVLRDDQWEWIAPLVPGKVGDPGRSAADNRLLLEAVLWIVRVGAPLAHPLDVHIFIDFGQLCSWKPDTDVHGNRTAVFMISATRFQPGQHP